LNERRNRILGRAFGAVVLVGTLAIAFVDVSPSGAATFKSSTINNYCESMIADHPTPPTNNNAAAYHAWAKQNLKYFEHLQSEANTAIAKSSLRVLVPILKVEATSSNKKSLGAYIASHEVTWVRGWTDFDKTVVVCAKWAIDLL
jgi:hypothetical protein